jgi:hypothetical protein
MLDNVVSPIACVDMNHQNQLEQMANGAMFATHIQTLTEGVLSMVESDRLVLLYKQCC